MPEYLAPGVYVEEVGFRAKPIEGVPTGTAGFAGMTRYGPVPYSGGPGNSQPRLTTSFTEFERIYGGLENIAPDSQGRALDRVNYTAHAARAFFANGGKRLYISRVFTPAGASGNADYGTASLDVQLGRNRIVSWQARWPGAFGNVRVDTQALRSENLAFVYPQVSGDPLNKHLWGVQAKRAKNGAVVEVIAAPVDPKSMPTGNAALDIDRLWGNIRRSVEDFLLVLWRNGALPGGKPEQAFFVRCDHTTMTQNDLDNGRMICLIGVAPVKPAEFVIFRIGQWTADAKV